MNKRLKIPENVTFESIDRNIYILNIDDGEYYELSESASIIWNEIVKEVCVEDIKLNVKSLFKNDEGIENDIDEIISNFKNIGLLEDH
tara:strand:- start:752 stop:1015 length:264 start_codon:yes stop_codon:yes gene_type:complete